MSFGLAKDRELNPGIVGVSPQDLGTLPDDILVNPESGRVDPRAWFPRPDHPLEIEIGCGKGTFLVQQAAAQPEVNFLGIERAREFWLYAADRCRRRGLTNVRLLNTNAVEFLHWRCPAAIARVIHLYFSDPWPKRRHHKNRVVQERFLIDAWRALVPGGELRIVTDHADYWEWMQAHFARFTRDRGLGLDTAVRFEPRPFEPPASAGEGELVGTNFERKYRREGRGLHSVALQKVVDQEPSSPRLP